jgi:alpha-ketoglutarate-dependent taurine dioxygenase
MTILETKERRVGGWTVTPLTGTFGASLSGKHLSEDLDGELLMSLLEKHAVLTFREQFLSPAVQSAVAHAMGEPTKAHPVLPAHPDFPEILPLQGDVGGKSARWHTDVTFVEAPPAASILVSDLTPTAGGDTLWADSRRAYETLNPALRDALIHLRAVHRLTPFGYFGEPLELTTSLEEALALHEAALLVPPVLHPLVRRHPSTGRPSLFVNSGFTTHIEGMSRIESDHLLALLYDHQAQPELTLRHHWKAGDVVMWDNRATQHYATFDYGSAERRMRRITLRGSRPVGVDGFESEIVTDPLVGVR